GDRARVSRALEVVLATGRSLAQWHDHGMEPALDPDHAIKIFLEVERAELYRRIDVRFDAMVAAGVLEEVRTLGGRGLDPTLPAMKAHGVPWLLRHLASEIVLRFYLLIGAFALAGLIEIGRASCRERGGVSSGHGGSG